MTNNSNNNIESSISGNVLVNGCNISEVVKLMTDRWAVAIHSHTDQSFHVTRREVVYSSPKEREKKVDTTFGDTNFQPLKTYGRDLVEDVVKDLRFLGVLNKILPWEEARIVSHVHCNTTFTTII